MCEQTIKKPECPVVITGLMGAGKTSIGRMLAEATGLKFLDSDKVIEEEAGCSIPEIFDRDGEPAFRKLEKEIIARILREGPSVIATGGGALMNPETAENIKKRSISIWLKADVSLLAKRVGKSRDRPLLKGEPIEEKLEELSQIRDPAYGKADIIIDSLDVTPEETLKSVIGELNEYIKNRH